MSKSFVDLLEEAVARPGPTPAFQVGQRVRVRVSVDVNTYGVTHLLGKRGVVDRVVVTPLSKRVIYYVRFGPNCVEPWEECELDARYARRSPGNFPASPALPRTDASESVQSGPNSPTITADVDQS